MFKKTYGITFLVALSAVLLTGPHAGTIANESATAPIVHVTQSVGGTLM